MTKAFKGNSSRKNPRSGSSDRPPRFGKKSKDNKELSGFSRKRRSLPEIIVAEVADIDADGETIAFPADWNRETDGPAPRIFIQLAANHAALAVGDRALLRLRRMPPRAYAGTILRRMEGNQTARMVGLYQETKDGGRVLPSDRRQKDEMVIPRSQVNGALDGELVLAELSTGASLGLPKGRIVERLGRPEDPHAISLIAIHTHEIPHAFMPEVVAEAKACLRPTLGKRTDLRSIPLVTIDGEGARDFDDAVYAEKDGNGWKLLVAIADVAGYVKSGSFLDRSAYERGNSTYFPDRVVPMLPEELSNDLCSLVPHEDRACMACWLWVDGSGRLHKYEFVRGLMRSAARLTYDQVQAAHDGAPDDVTRPLLKTVIAPLYGAFKTLLGAREARKTLELDLPERKVLMDGKGGVEAIVLRERFDSHRLIEEFMITANVAAARAIEEHRVAGIFRVHEPPSDAKAEALRIFLKPMGYHLQQAKTLEPRMFAKVLEDVAGSPMATLVSMVVLRSQAQAVYSPENGGHFGLALQQYAHFTSPIRRYADLIVHRALISAFGFGEDGLSPSEVEHLETIAEHISSTERRSALAERDAVDRFTALYLHERLGETFSARVTGVTRFGLFITLDGTGADGFIPMRTLRDDRYDHDEVHHCLIGQRWGRVFRLGAKCEARLTLTDPLIGSAMFELVTIEEPEEDWPPVNRKLGKHTLPKAKAKVGAKDIGKDKGSQKAGRSRLKTVSGDEPTKASAAKKEKLRNPNSKGDVSGGGKPLRGEGREGKSSLASPSPSPSPSSAKRKKKKKSNAGRRKNSLGAGGDAL